MLFNSLEFILFIPIVFLAYWFVGKKNFKIQNYLLLASSYFFYGWWDIRFLGLLLFIGLFNYSFGKIISNRREANEKFKVFKIIALVVNLGILVVFKYLNFFIAEFSELLGSFGYFPDGTTLRIIIPLGISFYIFLSISYILDISKGLLDGRQNLVNSLLSLSFFPIILSGPIERPKSLIAQFSKQREFKTERITDGLRQMLWGFFVKIVIADNLAVYVQRIFDGTDVYMGSTLFFGAILFSIQIYADFSGYSDIAIGTAKLLGIDIKRNFKYPYFAQDIADFWRRWHISLTTWFRDYLFLPIAFALSAKMPGKKFMFMKTELFIYLVGITITWLLTGFWHGANYTFIVWGVAHGLLLFLNKAFFKRKRKTLKRLGVSSKNRIYILINSIITFVLVTLIWVFFRADNVTLAWDYLGGIFSTSLFSIPEVRPKVVIIFMLFFLVIEYIHRNREHGLDISIKLPALVRWVFYYGVIFCIFWFGGSEQEFIYFQF